MDQAREELLYSNVKGKNPFKDKRVRDAIRISSDRETIATQLYGEAGTASPNTLVAPSSFKSPNTSMEYDLTKAAALLDEAGWTKDGTVRKKDGKDLALSYMTTVNPVRQKTQEILKQSWQELGIAVELRAIDAGVFFSSDAGNPDTISHFYADIGMFTNGPTSTYPLDYMSGFKSTDPATDLAQKSNQWSGGNYNRWVNEDFNKLWVQAKTELDPAKQVKLFIGMNDLVVDEVVTGGAIAHVEIADDEGYFFHWMFAWTSRGHWREYQSPRGLLSLSSAIRCWRGALPMGTPLMYSSMIFLPK